VTEEEFRSATDHVEAAWRALKANPGEQREAEYEEAYRRWRGLGGNRGQGRPSSGLSGSTARSQAARARQQQSAEKWERVAPLIQELRRAVMANDTDAMSKISATLVKKTEMIVKSLQVVHAQPNTDIVVLHGWATPRDMVLAYVPVTVLDDHFEHRGSFSGPHANLIVDRNLEVFAKIVSAKFERGEYRAISWNGDTRPRVDVTFEDLKGEKLIDPKDNTTFSWGSPEHRNRTV
jgi:hypothetical protein